MKPSTKPTTKTLRLETKNPETIGRWLKYLALTDLDPDAALDLAINIALVSLSATHRSKQPQPTTPRNAHRPEPLSKILDSLETAGNQYHTHGTKAQ